MASGSTGAASIILSKDNRSDWSKPSYWQKLCPDLNITASKLSPSKVAVTPGDDDDDAIAQRRRELLRTQGYARVDSPVMPSSLVEKMRDGIHELVRLGLPASFIFLFDETWQLAEYSAQVATKSCHPKNRLNFDVLAWYIDDNSGGFSPHRDRQPDNAKDTFHNDDATDDEDDEDNTNVGAEGVDGDAKFVTHWIALTDATPQNSCLYVIPKPNDPGYIDGDRDDIDPLQRALRQKQDYQCIRALPRPSGTSLLFTHRIIHWGSSRDATMDSHDTTTNIPHRIAISFVYCDPSFEPCYLVKYWNTQTHTDDRDSDALTMTSLPFTTRLLLVCAQLLIYYQRFDMSLEMIHACYQFCKDHEDELEQTYRHKVFLEYVKACKEELRKHGGNGNDDGDGDKKSKEKANDEEGDDGNEDDSAEEAMLEEMLNAEQHGYGEFEDDFDEEVGEGSDNDDDQEEEEEEEEEYKEETMAEEMGHFREGKTGDEKDDDDDDDDDYDDGTNKSRKKLKTS